MVSGVRLAECEHCARQGGDAAPKKITLPCHELAALDADRDAGGDGVGQIEIVLAELLLNRPAVEMEHAEPFARRAKERADNRCHAAAGDAAIGRASWRGRA